MVDLHSRRIAAELLRQLASGRITNDAFEDRWPTSPDPAVQVMREAGWMLYSDFRTYRLVGADRLPSAARREVSHWVLFLHSDLPYEWPRPRLAWRLALDLVSLATLGLVGRLWTRQIRAKGDWELWPFLRRSDFEAAVAAPRLLGKSGLTSA